MAFSQRSISLHDIHDFLSMEKDERFSYEVLLGDPQKIAMESATHTHGRLLVHRLPSIKGFHVVATVRDADAYAGDPRGSGLHTFGLSPVSSGRAHAANEKRHHRFSRRPVRTNGAGYEKSNARL